VLHLDGTQAPDRVEAMAWDAVAALTGKHRGASRV
jgi:hypothetical protein